MSQQTPIPLFAGDHLLYGMSDLFGLITRIKTWSPAVHIEVHKGGGVSLASRNGIGVSEYIYRPNQLIGVLRPKNLIAYDFEKGLNWFYTSGIKGSKYGWLDLTHFIGIKIPTSGIICSTFAAMFDTQCNFHPFHESYDKGSIDPGDFTIVNCFDHVWVKPGITF